MMQSMINELNIKIKQRNLNKFEQKTKLTIKTAKKWNKWLFAWRDKKPAKTIFINT